jgi:hypothetical protein
VNRCRRPVTELLRTRARRLLEQAREADQYDPVYADVLRDEANLCVIEWRTQNETGDTP